MYKIFSYIELDNLEFQACSYTHIDSTTAFFYSTTTLFPPSPCPLNLHSSFYLLVDCDLIGHIFCTAQCPTHHRCFKCIYRGDAIRARLIGCLATFAHRSPPLNRHCCFVDGCVMAAYCYCMSIYRCVCRLLYYFFKVDFIFYLMSRLCQYLFINNKICRFQRQYANLNYNM